MAAPPPGSVGRAQLDPLSPTSTRGTEETSAGPSTYPGALEDPDQDDMPMPETTGRSPAWREVTNGERERSAMGAEGEVWVADVGVKTGGSRVGGPDLCV